MKKIIYFVTLLILSIILASCNEKTEDIEAYAVVHYESNLMGGSTGRILFGTQFNMSYKKSTVYHINEKKKVKQIQPTKSGNVIFNNNAPWDKIDEFENIGSETVYFISDDLMNRYHKINEEQINIYKVTKIQDYGSVKWIDEIFLIKVSDIEAFDFIYKLEDSE